MFPHEVLHSSVCIRENIRGPPRPRTTWIVQLSLIVTGDDSVGPSRTSTPGGRSPVDPDRGPNTLRGAGLPAGEPGAGLLQG